MLSKSEAQPGSLVAVLVKRLEVIRARLPWAYECFQQKSSANGRGKQDILRNEAEQ